MGVINTGSPYTGSIKRTNPKPLDSSSAIDSYENARIYAANTKGEDVPYPGQIIATEGKAYILKVDSEMPDESANEIYHCKLDELGGTSTLDKRYLLRDVAETVEKLMTFLEGINVKGMATLEEITLLRNIVSQNFSAGSTGFGIYRDEAGNYHLDIDFVNIRRKLTADEIQVQQSSYIGGKQWNTAAGMICSAVEDKGTYWRCYFKTTDVEGRTVRNTFEKDDQVICETFNLDKQASGVLGNHYYWRLVVNKPGDDYIDLSKSDCDTGSDAPQVGDNIVQLGNRTDASRQGAICWDSVTAGGPYVRVYKGINSYHLPQPNIDLNPEESVIKAKLVSEATGKDVDTALGEIQGNLDIIKQQTDKEYTIWFYEYVPTLSNIPASEWTTNALKTMHEQDMFYNRESGLAYRFEKSGNTWAWNNITDQQTIKALENASKAQDTADGKRRTFVAQPTDSQEYDVGDSWVNATYNDGTTIYKNDSLVCKTAKAKGAAFSISHWKPTSTATTACIENLGNQIVLAVKDVADKNASAIRLTNESIEALSKKIHFDDSEKNITNINTSGLITTADFSALYGKEIVYDKDGHVDMTKMSGIITKDGLTEMFSSLADNNGYVRKAYIDLFVTQLPDKSFQSNAVISADQIRFNGNIVANDTFFVDTEGSLTLNNITANNGTFNGTINADGGTIGGIQINENSLGTPAGAYPLGVPTMGLSNTELLFHVHSQFQQGQQVYLETFEARMGIVGIDIQCNDTPGYRVIANLIAGKYGLKISTTGIFRTSDGGETWNSL